MELKLSNERYKRDAKAWFDAMQGQSQVVTTVTNFIHCKRKNNA